MNTESILTNLCCLNDFIEELDKNQINGHTSGAYTVISGFLMNIIKDLESEVNNERL